jgi:hypothetical protein
MSGEPRHVPHGLVDQWAGEVADVIAGRQLFSPESAVRHGWIGTPFAAFQISTRALRGITSDSSYFISD